MKRPDRKTVLDFAAAVWLFAAFLLYTAAVLFVDVQKIGPMDSEVGMAGLNLWGVKTVGGFQPLWYAVTEGLGALALAVVGGFALLGLVQLIKGKSFAKVDGDIYVLGGFYLLVGAAYVFFEKVIINYRPVMLETELEASYPSSHTVLSLCVFITAAMQLHDRLKAGLLRDLVCGALAVLSVVTVVGRWLSGVHWTSDILGGVLLSAALVMLYRASVLAVKKRFPVNKGQRDRTE